ncbi:MAG: hypothetical protein WA139_01080 [Candidatus Aenigmatarchaeota archaeon]
MANVKFLLSEKEDVKTAKIFSLMKPYAGGVDFRSNIYREIPSLKNIHLFGKKEAINKIRSEVKKVYELNYDSIESDRTRFENLWNSFDFARIEKVMDRKCGKAFCFVSIFDCNPRDIQAKSFQVYYKANDEKALQTIVHELIHFVYFDIYSKIFRRNPLNKQKTWDLSEIVAQIMQNEFSLGDSSYPAHRKIIPLFQKLWEETKPEGFNSFLKKSVKLMKEL